MGSEGGQRGVRGGSEGGQRGLRKGFEGGQRGVPGGLEPHFDDSVHDADTAVGGEARRGGAAERQGLYTPLFR